MQLLVGNPTSQQINFHYRVADVTKALIAKIPPRAQVKLLPLDMTEEQIKGIIEQLETYGAVPGNNVKNLRFSRSLIFSVQRPMTENQMNTAQEKEGDIRQEISNKETENAGCATIPTVLPQGIQDAMRRTQQTSTLHVEQVSSLEGERPQPITGGVNTTITVSKKAGARERSTG